MSPRWMTGLTRLLLGALPLLSACRSGIEESRYDAWDARIVELTERASATKDACAAAATGPERDRRVMAWDEVLTALMWARAAGALAYMSDDEAGLERTEEQVERLISPYPELSSPTAEDAPGR